MAKTLGYADAVGLLGGDGKALKVIDRFLGFVLLGAAATGTPEALGLLEAKAEAVRLGNELAGSLRDKVQGLGRYDRTQRLEAANVVIAITAFFEAIDDVALPFGAKELRLTKEEQLALSDRQDMNAEFDVEPDLSFEETLDRLRDTYANMAKRLADFIRGLAAWDRLDETERWRTERDLLENLPGAACRRYEILYRRLAVDFPEFACWANMAEHRATRRSLAELERLLSHGRVSPERLADLARANQAGLDRPILDTDQAPEGIRLPSLAEAYIDPGFRLSEHREPQDDLPRFLAAVFTQSRSTDAPLVVLGQPGAGKSVLTKVLAARLRADQFLSIRVPLREVESAGTIQDQIELSIRHATGETMSWPDLARSAEGTLPVVLLDGLDELLQATGAHWSDYLVRVAEFQRREAELGRPLAAVVTSRTAVADRIRIPGESRTVLLEPFSEDQVIEWLSVWAEANPALPVLAPENALAHRELAEQPLLLLMLALYNAESGDLSHGEALSRADLYERLLTRFARREVGKHRPDLPTDQERESVDAELDRLSVTAFAMFNRGHQWVAGPDLDSDLALLAPSPKRPVRGDFRPPLTEADRVIGRFFFIHHAQAVQDRTTLSTYEFLHPTFGEFLIARAVHRELSRLTRHAELDTLTDGRLYALLSFATLSDRMSIIEFLIDLAAASDARQKLRDLLVRLFHARDDRTDTAHSAYLPQRLAMPSRYVRYTANLVLLATVYGVRLRARELFPALEGPLESWRRMATLWRAGLDYDQFASLIDTLRPTRLIEVTGFDINLEIATDAPDPLNTLWWEGLQPHAVAQPSEMVHKIAYFIADPAIDRLIHAVEPALGIKDDLFEPVEDLSPARALLDAWLLRAIDSNAQRITAAYQRALDVPVKRHIGAGYIGLILKSLRTDIRSLPAEAAERILIHPGINEPLVKNDFVDVLIAALSRHPTSEKIASLLATQAADAWARPLLTAYLVLVELNIEATVLGQNVADYLWEWVSRLDPDDLAEVAREDPLLIRRARRLVAEHHPEADLPWPETDVSP